MREDSSVTVNYANLTFAFIKFQEQYKNLCQEISLAKKKDLNKSIKKTKSFVYEYLPFVKNSDFRDDFIERINKLNDDFIYDKEYHKIAELQKKNPAESIRYNQMYFQYLIRLFEIIGLFGDDLSKTFMPNKTDREKLFKYWNNNSFFEQFTIYKSNTAEVIANFSINKFKKGFAYVLGFYFAYYLFVDEKSRYYCEKIFTNILNVFLNKEILNLTVTPKKSLANSKVELLLKTDQLIHDGLSNIFFRCNYSYSQYGVMPRIEEKVLFDKTTI